MKKISFLLNGESRSIHVEPSETLLEVLRDRMGTKSPQCGCASGGCGACTVMLNDKTVRSCLIFAIETDGQEIVTLEGISKNGLSPLQKIFLEHNVFQCGYCAPGMILSATELISRNPHPTLHEIKEAIAGNLCRCTGYTPVIEAILELTKQEV
ncbi:MAG: (2Fe-2S)-binding protein [Bacteroidetes bacterium]|nr:(2Fe-2S)-binding protein [Bacteroidota bacterium]